MNNPIATPAQKVLRICRIVLFILTPWNVLVGLLLFVGSDLSHDPQSISLSIPLFSLLLLVFSIILINKIGRWLCYPAAELKPELLTPIFIVTILVVIAAIIPTLVVSGVFGSF